jgi:regulator of nucleoside diphosphate kinase
MLTPIITHDDRRQLNSMLQSARALGVERRENLHAMEAHLERARWEHSSEVPPDLVTMNSIVELVDADSGEIAVYAIVYPDCAHGASDRISVLSALGRAVLGSRVGDVLEVQAPSGWRRVRVNDVLYQPERPGEHQLHLARFEDDGGCTGRYPVDTPAPPAGFFIPMRAADQPGNDLPID